MDSAIDWLVEWWTRGAFFIGWMVAWWTRGLLGEMAEQRRLEATLHRAIADKDQGEAGLIRQHLAKLEDEAFRSNVDLMSRLGWIVADGRRQVEQLVTAAKASDLRAALLEASAEALRRRPLRFVVGNILRELRARVTRGGADHA